MKSIYLIGALANREIVDIGNELRQEGYDVFDDWMTPGPFADSYLDLYGKARGLSYKETLNTWAAKHVFDFDHYHLNRCSVAVLVMPCGKSGHMELGVMYGQGKPVFKYFPNGEPERLDVMDLFCTDLCFSMEELIRALERIR